MPIRRSLQTYDSDRFLQVLARMEGMRSPRIVTLDPNFVSQAVGADGVAQKLFAPGYFAGSIPGSNKARILPRTRTTAAVVTTAATMTVFDPQIFIPTDIITTISASGAITIGPATGVTWVAGDIATAVVAGVSVSYTVQASDVAGTTPQTAQAIATKLLAAIVGDYRLVSRVRGQALAGIISLFSRDLTTLHTLTVSKTGVNGTITASGATFTAGGTLVGTVSAINVDTSIITLTANAAIAVNPGVPVGVVTSSPANLGMIQPTQPIDLLRDLSTDVGLFTSASVYGARMPYWDAQLANLFPEITFASLVPPGGQ